MERAAADVARHAGAALREIAPGAEILDALFQQYGGRRCDKRTDGPAIAAAVKPPDELADLPEAFMAP